MLDEINEASILYNIWNRHSKQWIYTWLGKILISVNPYKLYPIYNITTIQKYQQSATTLPPHVYEISKGALDELEKSWRP